MVLVGLRKFASEKDTNKQCILLDGTLEVSIVVQCFSGLLPEHWKSLMPRIEAIVRALWLQINAKREWEMVSDWSYGVGIIESPSLGNMSM